jgi:hypothetical protein
MSLANYATTTGLALKMIGTVFDTATTNLASSMITDASEEIRKKLSKRYDFSLATFETTTSRPVILNTICETLALGYMYENMSRGSKEGLARADRYIKRGMENLDILAIGDAELIDTSGNVVDQISTDWAVQSSTQDYANTFNEDKQTNWKPDPDKIDDIKAERE